MRTHMLLLTVSLLCFWSSQRAHALTITYDFGAAPASTDFHGLSAATTEIDGVTLSATLFGGSAFNTSAGGLGASGVGSAINFDGEGGFSFNFDSPGTLKSITLTLNIPTSYDLITPNDGTDNYNGSFSDANYSFLAGEVFTFDHDFGSYRVQTIVIEIADAVPEPQTFSLALLGLIGLGWRRRCKRSPQT